MSHDWVPSTRRRRGVRGRWGVRVGGRVMGCGAVSGALHQRVFVGLSVQHEALHLFPDLKELFLGFGRAVGFCGLITLPPSDGLPDFLLGRPAGPGFFGFGTVLLRLFP